MKYHIQPVVDYILNPKKPLDLRAIKLFTLIVVLHGGSTIAPITGSSSKSSVDSLIIRVPRKLVRDARLQAGMKFLDSIETDTRQKQLGKLAPLESLIQNSRFKRIFNRVIRKSGSWNQIRYSIGLRDLQKKMISYEREARAVANLLDFSARFRFDPKKPKQIGGVTMATDIVTGEAKKYFDSKIKSTQMQTFWSRLKSGAPFFYLIYIQKFELDIGNVSSKGFAKKWRKRANNIENLRQFFLAYNTIAHHLHARQYNYSILKLDRGNIEDPITISEFSESNLAERRILASISRYVKG